MKIREKSDLCDRLEIKDCRELSELLLQRLRSLRIAERQVDYGGTFDDSVATALRGPAGSVRGFCFVRDGAIVGMVIMKRPPQSPDWVPSDAISLHGLKIASEYQGRGLGRLGFEIAVRQAFETWPDAKRLVLSVDAENRGALSVYRDFGMKDSGPVFAGRVGMEHRLEYAAGKR